MSGQLPTIFLSHSHADNAICNSYHAALRAQQFDVWYDNTHLPAGGTLSAVIQRELQARHVLVPLLSAASVTSYWVNLEIDAFRDLVAHDATRQIVPVMIGDCDVPLLLRGVKWIDGRGRPADAVISEIARWLSPGQPHTPPPPPKASVDHAAFTLYLGEIERHLTQGNATEHTHRPALVRLLEALAPGTAVTNEPKRSTFGAPDLVVALPMGFGPLTIGYVEAKDVGKSLDEAEKSAQLQRYLHSLDNLILTDYIEFRWYKDGQRHMTARLAMPDARGKLRLDANGANQAITLLEGFLMRRVTQIGSPKDLAGRMARLAHMVRDITVASLAVYADPQQSVKPDLRDLSDLYETLRSTLIPDLTRETFADMFAQTIAYGLFAARYNHHGETPFSRIYAAQEIPKTNPLLRQLFKVIASADNDAPYMGFVDDLAQMLAQTDMEAVLRDFGKHTKREDPIVHFYETFLTAYDPKLRELRGVYYTPEPVVSYIVRSTDHVLREHFGCADGLADRGMTTFTYTNQQGVQTEQAPRVLILDPACGTGTFLYSVVDFIRDRFRQQNNAGMWQGYICDYVLKRVFGFELLMAPYAMAHLKLGMQLAALDIDDATARREWAYDFHDQERLGVYLTNTLGDAATRSEALMMHFLVDEANEGARLKKEKPVMVILGNPPYSGHSANQGEWITRLLHGEELIQGTGKGATTSKTGNYFEVDGAPLGERNPKWLNDDYVKFLRFAQWRIERNGEGVVAFITNHGYLDNPTFRGMRQSLMATFDEISVLDLHGNSKKKERGPDGRADQNVFDIQQGVAIGIFVKHRRQATPSAVGPQGQATHLQGQTANLQGQTGMSAPPVGQTFLSVSPQPAPKPPATVRHAHLYGDRNVKYNWLFDNDIKTTEWTALAPHAPFYLFTPQDGALMAEYDQGWKMLEIMSTNALGFQTHRDQFAIDFDEKTLFQRLNEMRGQYVSDQTFAQKYELSDNSDWQLYKARQAIRGIDDWQKYITRCLYRPFDWRYCYLHEIAMDRPRRELIQNMLQANICLGLGRQGIAVNDPEWSLVSVTLNPGDANVFRRGGITLFPLYLYPDPTKPALLEAEPPSTAPGGRRPNLAPAFIAAVEQRVGMRFVADGKHIQVGHGTGQTRVSQPVGQTFLSASSTGQGHLPQTKSETTSQAERQTGMSALPGEVTIRRRSLPHWTQVGATYFVTFRVSQGSLSDGERQIVLDHLKAGEPQYYTLIAATVMPDHVHVLLAPNEQVELARIMKGVKGVSARLINAARGSIGTMWQEESFDRIVRDEVELEEKLRYMLNNPVKAGLVADGWMYPASYFSEGERQTFLSVNPQPASQERDVHAYEMFGPEDVFNYIYAVFHAPEYRARYGEFLKIDFPRVPLTSDADLFRMLCGLGDQLVGLHTMTRTLPLLTSYPVRGTNVVEGMRYTAPSEGGELGRVWLNATQYFDGVPPEVWEFHIGGYQVCQKWLKDRKGRTLDFDDLDHYQRVVAALAETMRLMEAIDDTITAHGGWPLT